MKCIGPPGAVTGFCDEATENDKGGRHSMHCAEAMKCRHTTLIALLQSGFELGALIPQIKYWSRQSGGILETKSRKQIEITLTILTGKYEQAACDVDTVASLMCTVLETKRGCLQSGASRQRHCKPQCFSAEESCPAKYQQVVPVRTL
jgi:hypothetical protein